jgi:hypothetical protein
MISDNRRQARVSMFTGGDVYRRPDGERLCRAIIKDVSAGGMQVETLEALQAGEQVFIDFQVPGGAVFSRVAVRVERAQAFAGSFLAGLSFQREDVRTKVREALAKLFGPDNL